jgi:hypothetical protein
MPESVTLAQALKNAKREMGRDVRPQGFAEHYVGPHIINILFYSLEYEFIGTQYRADLYEDGKKTVGAAFG